MLRKLLIAACLVLPVAALAADEQKPARKMTAQQQKMGTCNKEAGDKKLAGAERKKFMSECLKADHAAASGKMTAQQQKMADCNKQAADKKGDERKAFMTSCLKG